MKNFSIIVCMDKKRGIGLDGHLPWPNLTADMRHFKEITSRCVEPNRQNAVIMGRRTWESIPGKFRPLSGRINVIVTRQPWEKIQGLSNGEILAGSLSEALQILESARYEGLVENIFVIGGGRVYAEALDHERCQKLFVTHIDKEFTCDTFFPVFDERFKSEIKSEEMRDETFTFWFEEYARTCR